MDAIESIQEEIILMQLDLNLAFKTCTDYLTYDGCQGCEYCDKDGSNICAITKTGIIGEKKDNAATKKPHSDSTQKYFEERIKTLSHTHKLELQVKLCNL